VIGGVTYTLQLGFQAFPGGPILTEFITRENADNVANLYGRFTAEGGPVIPEPSTFVLLGAGLVLVGRLKYGGRKAAWTTRSRENCAAVSVLRSGGALVLSSRDDRATPACEERPRSVFSTLLRGLNLRKWGYPGVPDQTVAVGRQVSGCDETLRPRG